MMFSNGLGMGKKTHFENLSSTTCCIYCQGSENTLIETLSYIVKWIRVKQLIEQICL